MIEIGEESPGILRDKKIGPRTYWVLNLSDETEVGEVIFGLKTKYVEPRITDEITKECNEEVMRCVEKLRTILTRQS